MVQRQADRYTVDLDVELMFDGQRQWVPLQDLSRTGMFVQVTRPIPVGAKVHVSFAHEGRRVITGGQVMHLLPPAEATRLGRYPGIGIAFREPVDPADQMFAIAVDRLCRQQRASTPALGLHAVIAETDPRLVARMSCALSEAGFSVTTATTGVDAVAACYRQTPDVVVVARDLASLDGFAVLTALAEDPTLCSVPTIVTSGDLNDLQPAFELGALDFIARPYTTLELIVRARRLALASPRAPDRTILSGSLADLTLPALLSLLELERKSGRLVLIGAYTAWIDIAEGLIVGAYSARGTSDVRPILMELLDWATGRFELSTTPPTDDTSTTAIKITPLLLAHACERDEQMRDADQDTERDTDQVQVENGAAIRFAL